MYDWFRQAMFMATDYDTWLALMESLRWARRENLRFWRMA